MKDGRRRHGGKVRVVGREGATLNTKRHTSRVGTDTKKNECLNNKVKHNHMFLDFKCHENASRVL
jgi:hypothetical protein